jgi:hypothetical protein
MIKDLIESPHPIYTQNLNYWGFLLNSYEGGLDYTQAEVLQEHKAGIIDSIKVNGRKLEPTNRHNLFRHKKERSEDYIDRVRMSFYYNFCAPIIDVYTNHLFQTPVFSEFGGLETAVEARMENVDQRGSNLFEFRKEMAEMAQVYGHVFVVTDKPQAEQAPVSLAEQIETGMFPYFTLIAPYDVLNWAVDAFGNPYWVLVREVRDGNSDPFNFDKSKSVVIRYRLWTRDEWILVDDKGEELERATHGLGVVPVDCVYNKKSKKRKTFLGISEIADIAFIARDVYNRCSELNEIIRNQTFAFLAVQGKASDYDEVAVGTSKALLYPEGMATPAYISPPAENARTIMDQIDRQIHKMFQLAKLTGGSAAQDEQVDVQSGVSKAFDFHETNSALSLKASNLEDAEMRIWRTFAKWEGQAEFDGTVSYPRNFNVQALNEALDEAEKLMKIQLGQKFNDELKREIIKKKFPRVTDEDLETMAQEAQAKENQNNAGMQLRDRLPGLFNNNALPGGINGGLNNGRPNTSTSFARA